MVAVDRTWRSVDRRYRRLHEVARSAEVLLQYIEPLAACAELHLALAVHHCRADHLTTAFGLAPASWWTPARPACPTRRKGSGHCVRPPG